MTTSIGATKTVDSALRRAFSEASIRIHPDTRMTDVIESLTALGIAVTIQDGVLVLSQDTTTFNTSLALRNFAYKPGNEQYFILETHDPKSWTNERKIAFLKTHTVEEYGRLCSQPVIEAGIRVLDANMSRADYENLTRTEKVAFISEFGADAVSRILRKK